MNYNIIIKKTKNKVKIHNYVTEFLRYNQCETDIYIYTYTYTYTNGLKTK